MSKLNFGEWTKTTDALPEKPGKESYEHVDCWVVIDGRLEELPWNCEHECWDNSDYDDFAYEKHRPSHWMKKEYPPLPD